MYDFIGAAFKDGGIVLGFFTVFSVFFFIILNHFLKQSTSLTNIVLKQHESFNKMNENWQRIVDEHTTASKEYHVRASEADKYQREEHLKILDGMVNLLTTFKDEHRQRGQENRDVINELEKICHIVEKCEKLQ